MPTGSTFVPGERQNLGSAIAPSSFAANQPAWFSDWCCPCLALLSLLCIAGCADPPETRAEQTSESAQALDVGGCTCVPSGTCTELTYSDIPADGIYYLTTFGGGTDTQAMSCRGVADATWAYAAGRARFGCGAKLLIEAGAKSCVAEVADCGPNRCVEQAACSCSCANHFPIMNVSPLIAQYLIGSSSAGYSDHKAVKATRVADGTAIGCPGGPVGSGGASGAGGATGGAAGMGGTAGSAGASGGGTGGVAGSGGSLGTGGAGAVGGSAGTGGAGGVVAAGGSAGTGGASGVSGAAGAGGTGGSAGGAPDAAVSRGSGGVVTAGPTVYPPIEGGICSCRAPGEPARAPIALWLFCLLPLFRWRKRSRARVSL